MKALTLTQPWATLIAIGQKSVETRSWGTKYRGPLAIHAAKRFGKEESDVCRSQPFNRVLQGVLMPQGCVIATADLVDVQQIDAGVRALIISTGLPLEIDFGNYTTGRFAWFLANVQGLAMPIPAKGSLGLWDWSNA